MCVCGWVWVHPINSLHRISRRSGADEGHGHGMPKNLNQPAVFEPELGFPYPCCVETEPMSMALVPLDVPAQETWAPPVVDCAGSMDEDRAEPRLSGVGSIGPGSRPQADPRSRPQFRVTACHNFGAISCLQLRFGRRSRILTKSPFNGHFRHFLRVFPKTLDCIRKP